MKEREREGGVEGVGGRASRVSRLGNSIIYSRFMQSSDLGFEL